MKNLTNRQEEVLRVIVEFIREHMAPPTIREIGDMVGISSTNGVMDHLKALQRKGWLKEGIEGHAKSRKVALTGRARLYHGLFFSREDVGLYKAAVADLSALFDAGADGLDLSVCTTAEHGADVALRTVKKMLEAHVKIDPLEKKEVDKPIEQQHDTRAS